MSPDPVSWKVIERGWKVVGADGEELGRVHDVTGDANADIFNGLHVSPGLLRSPRYVPSERVRRILEQLVELDLTRDEFDRLEDAGPSAPQREVRPDTTHLS